MGELSEIIEIFYIFLRCRLHTYTYVNLIKFHCSDLCNSLHCELYFNEKHAIRVFQEGLMSHIILLCCHVIYKLLKEAYLKIIQRNFYQNIINLQFVNFKTISHFLGTWNLDTMRLLEELYIAPLSACLDKLFHGYLKVAE